MSQLTKERRVIIQSEAKRRMVNGKGENKEKAVNIFAPLCTLHTQSTQRYIYISIY